MTNPHLQSILLEKSYRLGRLSLHDVPEKLAPSGLRLFKFSGFDISLGKAVLHKYSAS